MHAGTAGDLANRAIAKQLLAPPDWGRLAAPLIRVAHTIVETTFSVIKGAVHGSLRPCLVSTVMHTCYLCLQQHLGDFVHGSLCMEKLPVLHWCTFCADYCKGNGPKEELLLINGFAFCAGCSKG